MATATELLRSIDTNAVQELAVELAYLDAAGYRNSKQSLELAQQFYDSLQKEPTFHIKSFLKEMLSTTVGEEKAEQIQTEIQDQLEKRDAFISIRSADPHTLASILENEHPRAVAVVLSELPAKKSSVVLGLLGQGLRLSVINRMTTVETVTAEARARIAETVCKRLELVAVAHRGAGIQAQPEQSLRKVAVILRNLGKELRDGLLQVIQKKDSKAGEKITNLKVVWDDIAQVSDRSMQEALRGVEMQKLALALYRADGTIVQKIKANISEQAAARLDEQVSRLSARRKEDVEEAREEIVQVLRQMSESD
jgi:flagellar motor switch protein FliG